mmetsp:Transcript_1480/g.2594  ORF Transcript_1480/g.2594 Transcript_1480/m.2594 type:complete len:239 (+) Transcript_1480:1521-2237(+)
MRGDTLARLGDVGADEGALDIEGDVVLGTVVFAPDRVEGGRTGGGILEMFLVVEADVDVSVADGLDQVLDLLHLPLGRQEPPLGLWRVGHRKDRLFTHRLQRILIESHEGVRIGTLLDVAKDLEFLVGEDDFALVLCVPDLAPVGAVVTLEEVIDGVLARVGTGDLLSGLVVADVVVVVVPLEGHIADGVFVARKFLFLFTVLHQETKRLWTLVLVEAVVRVVLIGLVQLVIVISKLS